MLLLLGLLIVLLFFGLGFTADILWFGILVGLFLIVWDLASGGRRRL